MKEKRNQSTHFIWSPLTERALITTIFLTQQQSHVMPKEDIQLRYIMWQKVASKEAKFQVQQYLMIEGYDHF